MDDNFGAATTALDEAFATDHHDLVTRFRVDLLRVLALADARGYGDRLLTWFDETTHGDQFWPLRAAFDAYVNGADRLRDVNPEVRGAASRLLRWLERIAAVTDSTGARAT